MKIRKLSLKNWKNFATVEVEIPDRLFLVGPNASGKSNFLDAFRFLRDLASSGGGLQEAVRRRGGVSAIRCLAARRESVIELGVEIEQSSGGKQSPEGKRWLYEVAFNQDKQGRPILQKERVLQNGQTLLDRPNDEDRSGMKCCSSFRKKKAPKLSQRLAWRMFPLCSKVDSRWRMPSSPRPLLKVPSNSPCLETSEHAWETGGLCQVRRSSPLPLKESWTKQSLVGSSGKRVVSQERCGMVAYRGGMSCEEASGCLRGSVTRLPRLFTVSSHNLYFRK